MGNFINADRDTDYLFPPSMQDWLPEDHLARFVVEVVDQLDLSALTRQYAGRGSQAQHPAVLLSLLIYGYATGVFSSRKMERATHDSIAFRYLAANTHPDHDTIATFRRRFLPQFEALFVQVLLLAREMKLLKLGRIALDGTKVKANASKHKALSYAHEQKIEAHLKAEVSALTAQAEAADQIPVVEGMDVPAEIARRDTRLQALAVAKQTISVNTDTMLVVSTHMTQATNDKQEIVPALAKLNALPEALGTVTDLLADTGYFGSANVKACVEGNIQPSLAVARGQHHLSVFDRFAPDTPVPITNDPVVLMKHQLTTEAGRALYALRKKTVEPVFGIIKHVMGLRQFSMRGLDKVTGEWTLATLALNVKRMNVLRRAL